MIERTKTKQFPAGLTERHLEMAKYVMEKLGYPTVSSVLQQGLVELYEKIKKGNEEKAN